ncbi:hypothetical protein K9L67_01560 [Candidatus Woesearchaeota archaeon]|nr:hypothetical protein [Candidatus Woesearchaeota archaeon]MCF7900890.1 hypothetical protein [Candidatus Woesearchaeota archaeon]MCF8013061.1 hypothetical protein [Candidatus Woesearchaeota archaeon]
MVEIEFDKIKQIIKTTQDYIENQSKKKKEQTEKLQKNKKYDYEELYKATNNHHLFSEHTVKVINKLKEKIQKQPPNKELDEQINILETIKTRIEIINKILKQQVNSIEQKNIEEYLDLYEQEKIIDQGTINNYEPKLKKYNIKIPKILLNTTVIILMLLGSISEMKGGELTRKIIPKKNPEIIKVMENYKKNLKSKIILKGTEHLPNTTEFSLDKIKEAIEEAIAFTIYNYGKTKQPEQIVIKLMPGWNLHTLGQFTGHLNTQTMEIEVNLSETYTSYKAYHIFIAKTLGTIIHETTHYLDFFNNPDNLEIDLNIEKWKKGISLPNEYKKVIQTLQAYNNILIETELKAHKIQTDYLILLKKEFPQFEHVHETKEGGMEKGIFFIKDIIQEKKSKLAIIKQGEYSGQKQFIQNAKEKIAGQMINKQISINPLFKDKKVNIEEISKYLQIELELAKKGVSIMREENILQIEINKTNNSIFIFK